MSVLIGFDYADQRNWDGIEALQRVGDFIQEQRATMHACFAELRSEHDVAQYHAACRLIYDDAEAAWQSHVDSVLQTTDAEVTFQLASYAYWHIDTIPKRFLEPYARVGRLDEHGKREMRFLRYHYSIYCHRCGRTSLSRKPRRRVSCCPLCGADIWTTHQQYLQTKEWKALRLKRIEKDNFRCTKCGKKSDLQVHHKTYKRHGHERLSDLVTLCRGCHAAFHEEHPQFWAQDRSKWSGVIEL